MILEIIFAIFSSIVVTYFLISIYLRVKNKRIRDPQRILNRMKVQNNGKPFVFKIDGKNIDLANQINSQLSEGSDHPNSRGNREHQSLVPKAVPTSPDTLKIPDNPKEHKSDTRSNQTKGKGLEHAVNHVRQDEDTSVSDKKKKKHKRYRGGKSKKKKNGKKENKDNN